jgi:hypothetical protein
MSTTRDLNAYIIVKPKGWGGLSARLASRIPALKSDEIAIKLCIDVPDALFKRPQLQASITIPESAVTPTVVNAEVLDNIREVLSQQTGLDVTVNLVVPEAS